MHVDDMTRSGRDNCPCTCATKQLYWSYVAYADSTCQSPITSTILGENPISDEYYKDCFTHLNGLEATLECGNHWGHIHEKIYADECGGEVAGTIDFLNGECIAIVVDGQPTSYGVLTWEEQYDPCVEPVCCESGWQDADGNCLDSCPGKCPLATDEDGCKICGCTEEEETDETAPSCKDGVRLTAETSNLEMYNGDYMRTRDVKNDRPVYEFESDSNLILFYDGKNWVVECLSKTLGTMTALTHTEGDYPETGIFSAEVPVDSKQYIDEKVVVSCDDDDCLSLKTLEEQVRCLQDEIKVLKTRVDTQCRGEDLQNMIDTGLEDLSAILQCQRDEQ